MTWWEVSLEKSVAVIVSEEVDMSGVIVVHSSLISNMRFPGFRGALIEGHREIISMRYYS